MNINDLKTPGDFQVQIFDADGKLVFEKLQATNAIAIGGLARGVYFLKIKFDADEINRKIIVQ